ncbi:hypothetical protein [Granulicella sp. WH15]|nr:hypothetical protein [Granulicella sp. WH15]
MKKLPPDLVRMIDKVLAYKPQPKSKAAVKRAEEEKLVDPYKHKKAAD